MGKFIIKKQVIYNPIEVTLCQDTNSCEAYIVTKEQVVEAAAIVRRIMELNTAKTLTCTLSGDNESVNEFAYLISPLTDNQINEDL